MYNGIPVFVIADSGEHGNLESIPAIQISLWLCIHVLYTLSIANAIRAHVVLC